MTTRCIARRRDDPIGLQTPTPSGLLAQRSQRWSCSLDERKSSTECMQTTKVLTCAHSARRCAELSNGCTRLSLGIMVERTCPCCSRAGRQRDAPWWLITPTCRLWLHFLTGCPGHQQTVGRRPWKPLQALDQQQHKPRHRLQAAPSLQVSEYTPVQQ